MVSKYDCPFPFYYDVPYCDILRCRLLIVFVLHPAEWIVVTFICVSFFHFHFFLTLGLRGRFVLVFSQSYRISIIHRYPSIVTKISMDTST
jgi:hypothetical protein